MDEESVCERPREVRFLSRATVPFAHSREFGLSSSTSGTTVHPDRPSGGRPDLLHEWRVGTCVEPVQRDRAPKGLSCTSLRSYWVRPLGVPPCMEEGVGVNRALLPVVHVELLVVARRLVLPALPARRVVVRHPSVETGRVELTPTLVELSPRRTSLSCFTLPSRKDVGRGGCGAGCRRRRPGGRGHFSFCSSTASRFFVSQRPTGPGSGTETSGGRSV